MEIAQAQRDVRFTFLGGFAGQLVCCVLWSASAAAWTWRSPRAGMAVLILGGFFIFPLTQLILRAMKNAYSLPKGHPMQALSLQVVFIVPLCLPLVLAVAYFHPAWFYPACMLIVGAHYLPFMFLYGMPHFGVLGGLMIVAAVGIAMYLPHAPSTLGAWITAPLMLVASIVGRSRVLAESARL